ncbi:hypothetical protein D3C85_1063930 [compost metagenome]
MTKPPPNPCRIRNTINISALFGVAHKREAIVNRNTDVKKTFFAPNLSDNHPANGMTAADASI